MNEQEALTFKTAVASLAAQVGITGLTSASFALPMPQHGSGDFQVILLLEIGSQIIEFVWYSVVVCRRRAITTWTRYIDWFFSTPIMLTTTAFFFEHRKGRSIYNVLTTPAWNMTIVFNAIMLCFGLFVELSKIPRTVGVIAGSVFFVASFTSLAALVDSEDVISMVLFFTMYIVWALYGVAALMDDPWKNISYNGLDIVSKNFYGVFLFVYLLVLDEGENK